MYKSTEKRIKAQKKSTAAQVAEEIKIAKQFGDKLCELNQKKSHYLIIFENSRGTYSLSGNVITKDIINILEGVIKDLKDAGYK